MFRWILFLLPAILAGQTDPAKLVRITTTPGNNEIRELVNIGKLPLAAVIFERVPHSTTAGAFNFGVLGFFQHPIEPGQSAPKDWLPDKPFPDAVRVAAVVLSNGRIIGTAKEKIVVPDKGESELDYAAAAAENYRQFLAGRKAQ